MENTAPAYLVLILKINRRDNIIYNFKNKQVRILIILKNRILNALTSVTKVQINKSTIENVITSRTLRSLLLAHTHLVLTLNVLKSIGSTRTDTPQIKHAYYPSSVSPIVSCGYDVFGQLLLLV